MVLGRGGVGMERLLRPQELLVLAVRDDHAARARRAVEQRRERVAIGLAAEAGRSAQEALERGRERRHRGELGQRFGEQVRQAPEVDARVLADMLDATLQRRERRRERRVVLHLDHRRDAAVQRAG
jgi:hypothetical protein